MKCCSACGQTLPDKLALPIHLSPMQRRIYERVHRAGQHGILSSDLFEWLYADDRNGGPLSGEVSMRTLVHQLNRRLAKIGKVVRAPRGGWKSKTAYTLRDLP